MLRTKQAKTLTGLSFLLLSLVSNGKERGAHKQIDIGLESAGLGLETNIYRTGPVLNLELDTVYHELNIGLNAVSLGSAPDVYGSVQLTAFDVGHFCLSGGIQLGAFAGGLHSFDYLTITHKSSNVYVGAYTANRNLGGQNVVGFMAGFAAGYEDWTLDADYLSGDNNLSGLSVNIGHSFDRFDLYGGVIVPSVGASAITVGLRLKELF